MILISGTGLVKEDLPNYDIMDYLIENNTQKMGIKLRTSAKSPSCFQIYIAEELQAEYTITDELAEKLVYFKSDEELVKLLDGGTTEEEDCFSTETEPEIVVPEFEKPKPMVFLEKKEEVKEEPTVSESNESENSETVIEGQEGVLPEVKVPSVNLDKDKNQSVVPEIDLEMANTELPDSFLMIPNINDDVDSLKMLLQNKDGIIAQKDGIIKDLKNKIDEAYKLQEMQLEEVENLYKQKMAECQNLISELEQRGTGVNLDEETSKFLKFINYARSNKAIVKEGFSQEEVMSLGVLRSKYTIFSYASGDSSYSMFKQIKKYIDHGRDCIVLDFSNDNFLASVYKMNSRVKNTMGLLKDDVSPLTLLSEVSNTKFIPTTSFNDIALLNVDWGKTLRKIDDLAGGKDVIMIFGAINNFNVRYTVSKLATIGKLFIFAKCSPVVLSSLYSDVQFLPKNRVRIVALEYIEIVKTILSELSKYFEIFAFSGDVEWNKLELK